jgi:uncharacterized protein
MRNLTELGSKLENLLTFFKEDTRILTVYIFGSFGTEKQNTMSDIDLGVLYDSQIPLLDELRYSADISSILKTDKVDVINLNTSPVYMQHQVLYTGKKIFERDFYKTADFVERVLEEFHDYEFILRKYREDYAEGLREEYLNG